MWRQYPSHFMRPVFNPMDFYFRALLNIQWEISDFEPLNKQLYYWFFCNAQYTRTNLGWSWVYRLDVWRATNGVHVETYKDTYQKTVLEFLKYSAFCFISSGYAGYKMVIFWIIHWNLFNLFGLPCIVSNIKSMRGWWVVFQKYWRSYCDVKILPPISKIGGMYCK